MLMVAALVALGCGAAAGIFLASRHFLRKRMSATVALLHGLGGATGFALVLFTVVREPGYEPIRQVLYLLIGTVVLGVVNLLFHIRKVRHRTSLILMHGFTAVTSAAMLIRAIAIHPDTAAAATPAPVETAVVAPSAAPPASASDQANAAAVAPSAAAPSGSAEPAAKAPGPTELVLDEATRRTLGQPITFETKSAEPSPESGARLAEIASLLKSKPEIELMEVQGHADERGEDGANIELTRARAAAVVNALVASGVARGRLGSAGYGARCPASSACQQAGTPESCHDAANWQLDRRVVFQVLRMGGASFKGEVACARASDLIPPAHRQFHAPAQSP